MDLTEEHDHRDLLERAARWMAARGWRTKRAKSAHEQSLFEHSLIEMDVLLQLLPILVSPRHYGLSEVEQRILIVAVLAHDVGKETDAWQAYIRNPGPTKWVPHVLPELTRAVVPEVCDVLGFENLSEPVQRIMAHCAEFHHSRAGRSDGAILEAMLTGGSDRFLTLATLVKAIDHLCSAASATKAQDAAEGDPALANHLRVARHEVVVRGVSTTFLHRATQATFESQGWKPLLYFSNATVYGADPNDRPGTLTLEAVEAALEKGINEAISRDVTPLMVGSPTGNILPKPDLLSFAESRKYLLSAAEKIGPQSFVVAYQREKQRLSASGPGTRRRGKTKADVVRDYWRLVGRVGAPYSPEMDLEVGRISVAQPEMLVFKFFKAMVDPDKVVVVGQDGAAIAERVYEEAFGPGSWAALQSTSTLMAAKDMANTVDYFWRLPGAAVGHPEVGRVDELPDQARAEVLIGLLDRIAREVYEAIGRPAPRDELARSMARAFVHDLVRPVAGGNVQDLAREQLDHYGRSKPFAGVESARGAYLCPICNAPFREGHKASADFIDNPQSHTNRGVAHGRFGYVMVCETCYYERLLTQVLMGGRPAEMVTMLPRLNLGPQRGQRLIAGVREWISAAKGLMRGEGGNLEWGFSLGLTELAARRLGDRDPLALEPQELVSVFMYRYSDDTQKRRKREATQRLKEEFDDDLEALNAASGQSFPTWEATVDALVEGGIVQQEFLAIRREVFRLYETIHLICQTPNLIFVPLSYEVAAGDDESDTSKALRSLYVAVILSQVFDASVAIHKQGEPVDFRGGAGAAYVPPVPAVRALVGHDWVPIDEARRWLSAIGAAGQLARDTGLPVRSALYQILAADPPERIARRIEEHLKRQKPRRSLTADHLRLIAALPGFGGLRVEEVSR